MASVPGAMLIEHRAVADRPILARASIQHTGFVLFQICKYLNIQGVVTTVASLQLIAKPFQLDKLFGHFALSGC